jgi:hypothetical protein
MEVGFAFVCCSRTDCSMRPVQLLARQQARAVGCFIENCCFNGGQPQSVLGSSVAITPILRLRHRLVVATHTEEVIMRMPSLLRPFLSRLRHTPRRNVRRRGHSQRSPRAVETQQLEQKMLLATWVNNLDPVLKDFEASGASQFGGGQAVYTGNAFLGIENFDTGKFVIDAFDEGLNAGAKADFRLFGKAGIDMGYYVNTGSIDARYEDVTLTTRYQQPDPENWFGEQLIIDTDVHFTGSGDSYFRTISPTIGAYADLVLQAKTRGSITGRLPWPFNDVGGTLSLNSTLIDINQELLSFNRNGSNQLRLMGEDVLAGGVEMVIPVSTLPPANITLAAGQLQDEQGNSLLGLDAAATLNVSGSVNQLLPKSVKKGIDGLDSKSLKKKARELGKTPFSVSSELATLQLNVPQVNLSSSPIDPSTGQLAGNNNGQRSMSNLLAGVNLNLGLKDTSFTIDPVTLTLTPFNFQVSPTLYVTQQIQITPQSRITYRFNQPVTGVYDGTSFGGSNGVRRMTIDPARDFRVDFYGSPIIVTPEWNFEARVSNTITINSSVTGKLTLADLKVEADLPDWLNDIVKLPYDPDPLYEKSFNLAQPASFQIDVGVFSLIDDSVSGMGTLGGNGALDAFVVGGNINLSTEVTTRSDDFDADPNTRSLREALRNARLSSGSDVIYLDAGTYNLSETGSDEAGGDLDIISGEVTIVGKGVGVTIIDANSIDRIFEVHPGAKLVLRDLTLQNGMTSSNGGAILNRGDLEIYDGEVTRTTNLSVASASNGGLIYQSHTSGAEPSSRFVRTSLSHGRAGDRGGAVFGGPGYTEFLQSTISHNHADQVGGGIHASGSSVLVFTSSTISSNQSNFGGAAIWHNGGAGSNVSLESTTVTDNSRVVPGDPSGVFSAADVSLRDSILANNGEDLVLVLWGTLTDLGHNLVESTSVASGWATSTILGQDPVLSPLGDFGGPTETHLLLTGSPAIGKGTPDSTAPDQRGQSLTPVNDQRDIGATQLFNAVTISPSDPEALATAIQLFNLQGGANRILLQPGTHTPDPLVAGIHDGGDLDVVGQALEIVPSTGAGSVIIDGRNLDDRVFDVAAGATLQLHELTVSGGTSGAGDGGGIRNAGTLGLTQVQIVENRSRGKGGGLHNTGTLTVIASTFRGNQSQWGGGLSNAGTANIARSLLHANVAQGAAGQRGWRGAGAGGGAAGLGGGILNDGVMTVVSTTLSGNQAIGGTGGDVFMPNLPLPEIGGSGAGLQGGAGGSFATTSFFPLTYRLSDGSDGGFGSGGGGTSGLAVMVDVMAPADAFSAGDGGFGGGGGGGGIGSGDEGWLLRGPKTYGRARRGLGGQYGGNGRTGKVGSDHTVVNHGGAGGGGAGIGGGIFSKSGTLNVVSSTIVNNSAAGGRGGYVVGIFGDVGLDRADAGTGVGGGIFQFDGSVAVGASVIAVNDAGNSSGYGSSLFNRDVVGSFQSEGNNFIGIARSSTGFTSVTDRRGNGTDGVPAVGGSIGDYILDPLIGPLAVNGGPTLTHAPLVGSPLIDSIDPLDIIPRVDQRGYPIGIGKGGDVGALEWDELRVTTTEDSLSLLSLRQAVVDATKLKRHAAPAGIRLGDGTYDLTIQDLTGLALSGDLDIESGTNVHITGLGPGTTFIDATQLDNRAFEVFSGGSLILEGLTLVGGTFAGRGGLLSNSGSVTLRNVHVAGVEGSEAIFNGSSGQLTLDGVTISGVSNASGVGGGIRNAGVLNAFNLTVTGNSAASGSAIVNESGATANLTNVTISGNTSLSGTGAIQQLGGVINLRNAIVYGNTGGDSPDISGGIVSLGNNIIGDPGTATGFDSSDLLSADPRLDALVTSGLPHYPLLLDSPAMEGGSATGIPATDALANPRTLGGMPDIGAVEQVVLHVSSADASLIPGTLRFAIVSANQLPGDDRVTIDATLNGVSLQLGGQHIDITESLSVVGNGAARTVIDAQRGSRIFEVMDGNADTPTNLTLAALTLRNGRAATDGGGAIRSNATGTLTLDRVHAVGNSTVEIGAGGGAVSVDGSNVRIIGSTFSGNSTQGGIVAFGGAIYASDATIRIADSTLSLNMASGLGGALYARDSTLDLENVTIADNTSATTGGGVHSFESTITLVNVIAASNSATDAGPDIAVLGGGLTAYHSLVGDNSDSTLAPAPVGSPDANGNVVGTAAAPIDALLEVLQENGGGIPTRALLPGSPAIDTGSSRIQTSSLDFVVSPEDQRGFARGADTADMGAFEVQRIQNLSTLPTEDVTVVDLDATRYRVDVRYDNDGTEVTESTIVAKPGVRLNILPFIAPAAASSSWAGSTTIGRQLATPGEIVGPLDFTIFDHESSANSLTVTARSLNEAVIPSSGIQLGGTGGDRTVTVQVPSGVFGDVPIVLTVADADGSSDFTFVVSVAGVDVSGLSDELPDGTNTQTRIDLGTISPIDGGQGTSSITLSGTDADKFELDGSRLYLKAGTSVDFSTQPAFDVAFELHNSALPGSPDAITPWSLIVNVAPTGITFNDRIDAVFSSGPLDSATLVARISVDDVSGTQLNTLDLTGADADFFEIIDDGLYLKAGVDLDAASKSSYSVTVEVNDPTVGNSPDASATYNLQITSAIPNLTAPGPSTSELRPEFQWESVPGAESYELWIKNQSTETNPFHRETVSGTSWTPTFDLGIGTFNIWVQATDALGHKSGWTTQTNTTVTTRVSFNAIERFQNTSTPTLSWESLTGADRYDLWINNLSTGESQFVRDQLITGPSWTPSSELPLGRYRAWVRGIDAAGVPAQWSSATEFVVAKAPTITFGQNPTFDRTPEFSWEPVTGADHYEVFVRNRNTGATTIYERAIGGTNWTPAADLADGPYRWWAIAVSAENVRGLWSEPQDTYIGGRSDVLTPTGTMTDTTPAFTWRAVDGAVRYELFVDHIGVQAGIINETGLTSPEFTPAAPLAAGDYRVWVRAVSSTAEKSPWSLQVNFSVAASEGFQDRSDDDAPDLEFATMLTSLPLPQTVAAVEPSSRNAEFINDRHSAATAARDIRPAAQSSPSIIAASEVVEGDDWATAAIDLVMSDPATAALL